MYGAFASPTIWSYSAFSMTMRNTCLTPPAERTTGATAVATCPTARATGSLEVAIGVAATVDALTAGVAARRVAVATAVAIGASVGVATAVAVRAAVCVAAAVGGATVA